jgi:hypothetical protein
MPIINDRTTSFNLALPNLDNRLEDDVPRIREALLAIDVALADAFDDIVSHGHGLAVAGGASGFMSGADKTKLNAALVLADLTKSAVGLSNVENVAPADLPVSTATATAIANAVAGISVTKSAVGLGNADNTSDADKPVSTAQATAISNAVANINLSNPTVTAQILVDAATTNWNMNLGHVARWSIGATNRNLNITNQKDGVAYVLRVTLGTPATMTPNWPANWRWQFGTVPDFTASAKFMVTLQWIPEDNVFWAFAGPGFS